VRFVGVGDDEKLALYCREHNCEILCSERSDAICEWQDDDFSI
jgi:hypothetical protein